MNEITGAQIKKIHILRNEIRMSDEEYRDFLQGSFSTLSSKNLSFQQAKKAIELLENVKKEEIGITSKQLAKLNYLAGEVYSSNVHAKLKKLIKNTIGYAVQTSDLTSKEASTVISVLGRIKEWKEKKE